MMKPKFVITDTTIGADPEVFVYSDNMQQIVSSIGLIGGSKHDPRPLPEKGFFVQEDNVLAEFNIPPAKTRQGFIDAISQGRNMIKEILPPSYSTIIRSSHTFTPEQLNHPDALAFGCEPDYNAWTNKQNPVPNAEGQPCLRTSGGHIHIGYKDPNKRTNLMMTRMFDAYLGVPSIIIDLDTERRKLYGKAGCYRDKDYGVEYRTLSSFWLASPELIGWAYDNTMEAIKKMNEGDLDIIENEAYIVDTINRADREAAELFIEDFEIKLPAMWPNRM